MGVAGVAVAQAGVAVREGGEGILPLTRAGHPQGEIDINQKLLIKYMSRSRSRSSTPAGIPRREGGSRPVKKEAGAGGSGKSTAPLQKRLAGAGGGAGVTGHRQKERRRSVVRREGCRVSYCYTLVETNPVRMRETEESLVRTLRARGTKM